MDKKETGGFEYTFAKMMWMKLDRKAKNEERGRDDLPTKPFDDEEDIEVVKKHRWSEEWMKDDDDDD